MSGGLTPRQQRVLRYLDGCNHATRNTMRKVFDGAAPTITLRSLERHGYVTSEESSDPLSTNVRWTITEAGREVLFALGRR